MSQLAKGIILPTRHQEQLVFFDIFGKRFDVYLNITSGPDRAAKIASTLSSMNATEASIQAYATANGHDLTAAIAAGTAALAAFNASGQ